MKKILLFIAALTTMVVVVNAETREVTLNSNISCGNCVRNIKEKIRFEKGVKRIEPNLEDKTVKIMYDGEKNSADSLAAAVTKIGYKSTVISDKAIEKKKK